MSTIVMKFGGAAVASPAHFNRIARIVIERKKVYQRIVIVVSAMGGYTDQLIALAKQVNPDPPSREYDMLVSVGERISIALLAMALAKEKIDAVSFTGSQSGIITCNRHSNAKIVDVRPKRLLPYLDQDKIVIVAGFQGVSTDGEITTLGRNGSDVSAVALGVALDADIEFYKDVHGIYNRDPKADPAAALIETLSYDEAIELVSDGSSVLHPRCIELAKKNRRCLYIRSFDSELSAKMGTVINPCDSEVEQEKFYEEAPA